MNTDKLLELLFYVLPAVITGAVAFHFFRTFLANEDKKRRFSLMREGRKITLPLRLQAYERMTLFMERIDPSKLLLRVTPISTDKHEYVTYVIAHIEQEFEHNLTQQIYLSDECWAVINTAKSAIIQQLRKTALSEDVKDADALREAVILEGFGKDSASFSALSFIKNEVSGML